MPREDVDAYAPTLFEDYPVDSASVNWSNGVQREASLADDFDHKTKMDFASKVEDEMMILKMPGDDISVTQEESKTDSGYESMVLKMPGDAEPSAKEESNNQHATINVQYPKESPQPSGHDQRSITTDQPVAPTYQQTIQNVPSNEIKDNFTHPKNEVPAVRTSSGFLSKPSNIYAQPEKGEPVSPPKENKPFLPVVSEQPELEMKLVMKDSPTTADEAKQPETRVQQPAEDFALRDDAGDQKRRAAERIQKLRNLSFNMNAADPNNEFEAVPAYIRRNMEMFGNTLTSVENFYSKYTVSKDENNKTEISTINTFLDGKKPD